MERYSIVINPEAEDDLDDIVDYLATLSEQVAVKYYDLIIEKINSLSARPLKFVEYCMHGGSMKGCCDDRDVSNNSYRGIKH